MQRRSLNRERIRARRRRQVNNVSRVNNIVDRVFATRCGLTPCFPPVSSELDIAFRLFCRLHQVVHPLSQYYDSAPWIWRDREG